MKYLCLGYHDEALFESMSPSEREAMIEETVAYANSLRKGGHILYEQALQSSLNAATLRFSSGGLSVTDGPFAETKEQLGGIMLIEANDLNDAIRLVSNMPCMRLGGCLEIRPINEQIGAAIRGEAADELAVAATH